MKEEKDPLQLGEDKIGTGWFVAVLCMIVMVTLIFVGVQYL